MKAQPLVMQKMKLQYIDKELKNLFGYNNPIRKCCEFKTVK